ncbi:hypothetical protein J9B76_30300, partial [Klebsiella pneumoniae]
ASGNSAPVPALTISDVSVALIAEASVLSALFVAKRVSAMSPPDLGIKKPAEAGYAKKYSIDKNQLFM